MTRLFFRSCLLVSLLLLVDRPSAAQLRSPVPSVGAYAVVSTNGYAESCAAGRSDRQGKPPRDRWIALDKAKHLGGSALLTLSTQYVLVVKGEWTRGDALPLSVGTAASIGLAKELYDRYAGPTRVFSRKDLVADVFGIAVGVLVIVV